MTPITVLVVGGSGRLGSATIHALLACPSEEVSSVKFTTRDASSDKSKALIAEGAKAIELTDAGTVDLFKNVDVLINAVGGYNPRVNEDLIKVALKVGPKVYFTPDFGMDHHNASLRLRTWDALEAHIKLAEELTQDRTRIVSVVAGGFMPILIHPMLGLDTKKRLYSSLGPVTSKFSVTNIPDVGKALARLSVLTCTNPELVPNYVRISGDVTTVTVLAESVSKVIGDPIQVQGGDLETNKTALIERGNGPAEVGNYINWILASGAADYSTANENELVNPGQTLWKWETMGEWIQKHAEEIKYTM